MTAHKTQAQVPASQAQVPDSQAKAPASQAEAPAAQPEAPEEVILPAFAPLEAARQAFRFWWLVVVLVVIGGLAGLLAARARPPLYEAQAQFAAGIDYVRTGPLTQFEEDTAYNTILEILHGPETIGRVLAEAQTQGLPVDETNIAGMLGLERRFHLYILRVRHPDPAVAERLANLWLDQGRRVVEESYTHAINAHQLEDYVRSLERCLTSAVKSEPAYGLEPCSQARFADLQQDLQAAGAALQRERLASRAMFTGLVPGEVRPAVVSSRPVADGQSQFVLGGALLGFILAVALIETGLPGRWRKG